MSVGELRSTPILQTARAAAFSSRPERTRRRSSLDRGASRVCEETAAQHGSSSGSMSTERSRHALSTHAVGSRVSRISMAKVLVPLIQVCAREGCGVMTMGAFCLEHEAHGDALSSTLADHPLEQRLGNDSAEATRQP
jgi:hypothetical protein